MSVRAHAPVRSGRPTYTCTRDISLRDRHSYRVWCGCASTRRHQKYRNRISAQALYFLCTLVVASQSAPNLIPRVTSQKDSRRARVTRTARRARVTRESEFVVRTRTTSDPVRSGDLRTHCTRGISLRARATFQKYRRRISAQALYFLRAFCVAEQCAPDLIPRMTYQTNEQQASNELLLVRRFRPWRDHRTTLAPAHGR